MWLKPHPFQELIRLAFHLPVKYHQIPAEFGGQYYRIRGYIICHPPRRKGTFTFRLPSQLYSPRVDSVIPPWYRLAVPVGHCDKSIGKEWTAFTIVGMVRKSEATYKKMWRQTATAIVR